jgi:hypothetical protein
LSDEENIRLPAAVGDELVDLSARVRRLESLVEGLQDAIYREATRQDERINELRARTDPGVMARALSAEARKRGV